MTARERISLDGTWNFWADEHGAATHQTFSNGPAHTLQVPGPWQANPALRNFQGTGWYQTHFELPERWAFGQTTFLHFGAVDYFAAVWVNGAFAGEHENGYLPFELNISEWIKPGRNTLVVRVRDPQESFAEVPHGKQSWYGLLSGIWQPAWIESQPVCHFRRVKITTTGNVAKVDIEMAGGLPDQLHAGLITPNGTVMELPGAALPGFSFSLPEAAPWSPDTPNLYRLVLSTGEDEITETFGFRQIEARDGRLYLNGQPFYLRGALDQDYYPDLICTPPSQAYIEDTFRKAKTLGLNCLRVHIKVADPRYYAAADEVGLLIWTELPNHALLTEESKRRARETIHGMVVRDWNHPSLCIWTIINEAWGIDVANPEHRAWLAGMYAYLKALDPTRLAVGNSPCWGNFNVVSDIDDYHMYFAMPDHYTQWRDWVAAFAQRPWWTYAWEYRTAESWREVMHQPWIAAPQSPAAEVVRSGHEPLLVSEFGNWGLPDVEKLRTDYNGEPWWFETGLDWGEGVVYPHGVEQRFHQYGLNRVFSTLQSLSQASQRLQYQALKFEIEQIRRYPSIQGYVITELTDVHWESNGLLDMLRGPKACYDRFIYLNADDVVVPVWDRLALTAGETRTMPIVFSHFSRQDVGPTTLFWQLRCEGSTLEGAEHRTGCCAAYTASDLGKITFTVPPAVRPVSAVLDLRLVAGMQEIASTSQELLILPAPARLPRTGGIFAPGLGASLQQFGVETVESLDQATLAIVDTLDDRCRSFLLKGGRVIFLAEKSGALQTVLPGVSIGPRAGTPWQGDWASSFGWHRFSDLPNGGVVDFSFAGLTPNHVIHGFAPRDFPRDVFAGLFVGWLHRPVPTIARKRIGRGELLLSTFQLSENLDTHPLAAYLLGKFFHLINESTAE